VPKLKSEPVFCERTDEAERAGFNESAEKSERAGRVRECCPWRASR